MSKNKQKTHWFQIGVKPVHIGVYEIRSILIEYTVFYSKWDGEKWCDICSSHQKASEQTNKSWIMYSSVKPKWRGFKHEQT